MKLPKIAEKFNHNDYCDEILNHATELASADKGLCIADICKRNLADIMAIRAKILHLEMALEEIMKGVK